MIDYEISIFHKTKLPGTIILKKYFFLPFVFREMFKSLWKFTLNLCESLWITWNFLCEIHQDDDSCEEWERHEALTDDPTNQERNKERLFEEEIELKWEKGGSGLVFYTDAQYWQEQEGGKSFSHLYIRG